MYYAARQSYPSHGSASTRWRWKEISGAASPSSLRMDDGNVMSDRMLVAGYVGNRRGSGVIGMLDEVLRRCVS